MKEDSFRVRQPTRLTHQEMTLGPRNETIINPCPFHSSLEDTNGTDYHSGHQGKCLGAEGCEEVSSAPSNIYQCSRPEMIIWPAAVCCTFVISQAVCPECLHLPPHLTLSTTTGIVSI